MCAIRQSPDQLLSLHQALVKKPGDQKESDRSLFFRQFRSSDGSSLTAKQIKDLVCITSGWTLASSTILYLKAACLLWTTSPRIFCEWADPDSNLIRRCYNDLARIEDEDSARRKVLLVVISIEVEREQQREREREWRYLEAEQQRLERQRKQLEQQCSKRKQQSLERKYQRLERKQQCFEGKRQLLKQQEQDTLRDRRYLTTSLRKLSRSIWGDSEDKHTKRLTRFSRYGSKWRLLKPCGIILSLGQARVKKYEIILLTLLKANWNGIGLKRDHGTTLRLKL